MPGSVPLFAAALAAALHAQGAPAAPPDYSKEAFIIEEARTVLRFEDDGTGRRQTYMRVKTQSDAGVQAWGQLVLGYNAANERLDIEYVRVRKADGTTVTAPPESVQDLSSPVQQQAPVYTDYRQKHVTVPGLRPGETLEVSTITTIVTPLALGHFWAEDHFQKDAVVLREQLELDVPAARALTLKTGPGADPEISTSAGRRIYRWKSDSLVPSPQRLEQQKKDAEEQPESPSAEPKRAAVRLTTFQDWAEVGRWDAALEKAPRVASAEVRKKAADLTAGRTGDLEKIEALYDFVGPNFRYVSISLGAGRYQPRAAGDVFRDQYGDCKDKHTLLASMLESVGLRASTVLINSRVKIDPAFPSPSQFDHAITRTSAGGQPVWLDVTPEVAPFRLLSPNLRRKQALVIGDGEPARLEETPADPPMVNSIVQEVDGTLEAFGRMNARVRFVARGDVELFLRVLFRHTPQANWKDVLSQIDATGGLDGEVSDWKISDPAANHEPFSIEFRVSRANYIDASKKRVELALPYSGINLPAFDEGKTADPIELGSPQTVEYRIRLELGAAYQPRLPVPVTVDRDYAKYVATYAVAGQVFTATRSLTQTGHTLPAARAGDYRTFRRVIAADAEQKLPLDVDTTHTTAADPAMKAADLDRSGYDALNAGNFDQALTLLTRVVELEPAHKTAWIHLGQAYVGLRRYPDAIAAFKKQLEINPYDEFANNNLAAAYVRVRQYADAEATFRKQLEANPLDRWTHGALGRMDPRNEALRGRGPGAGEGHLAQSGQRVPADRPRVGLPVTGEKRRGDGRVCQGRRAERHALHLEQRGLPALAQEGAPRQGAGVRRVRGQRRRRVGPQLQCRPLQRPRGRRGAVARVLLGHPRLGAVCEGGPRPRRAARRRLVAALAERRGRRSPRADLRETGAEGRGHPDIRARPERRAAGCGRASPARTPGGLGHQGRPDGRGLPWRPREGARVRGQRPRTLERNGGFRRAVRRCRGARSGRVCDGRRDAPPVGRRDQGALLQPGPSEGDTGQGPAPSDRPLHVRQVHDRAAADELGDPGAVGERPDGSRCRAAIRCGQHHREAEERSFWGFSEPQKTLCLRGERHQRLWSGRYWLRRPVSVGVSSRLVFLHSTGDSMRRLLLACALLAVPVSTTPVRTAAAPGLQSEDLQAAVRIRRARVP